jgi:anti-sigma factor RsiW
MQSTMTRAAGFRPAMGRLVLALLMAGAVAGALAVPARADEHGRSDRERSQREAWREHHRRPAYVVPPAVVYAPPPVVYAPPPPPVGINLIFPFSIR